MDLQSLGHAAAMYQRDPRVIRSALAVVQAEKAAAAGTDIPHEATPVLTLNGVQYFAADEIVAALGWLTQRDAEKSRVRTEAAANV